MERKQGYTPAWEGTPAGGAVGQSSVLSQSVGQSSSQAPPRAAQRSHSLLYVSSSLDTNPGASHSGDASMVWRSVPRSAARHATSPACATALARYSSTAGGGGHGDG